MLNFYNLSDLFIEIISNKYYDDITGKYVDVILFIRDTGNISIISSFNKNGLITCLVEKNLDNFVDYIFEYYDPVINSKIFAVVIEP